MKIDEYFQGSIRTEEKYFTYHLLGCKDHELSINGIGLKETMKPGFNRREEGNNDYLILYFYDNIDISVECKKEINIHNKWIILTPGTSHSYGNQFQKWSHSWLHVSGIYFEKQLREHNVPLNELQSTDTTSFFESMLIGIHEEVYFNNSPIVKIIKNYINTWLLKISRHKVQQINSFIPENFLKVKQILDFRYHENLPLSLIAEIAGYTIPYLCLKFKEIYKISPTDYLIQRRISIAKYFLVTTSMRISEISYKVGYNDIYYFSKIFKKKVLVSPSQYRIQNTKNEGNNSLNVTIPSASLYNIH